MLVVSRRPGQALCLDLSEFGMQEIKLSILKFDKGAVRIGIDADKRIRIRRSTAEDDERDMLERLKKKYES